jgi:hypothetical protein
VDISFFTDRLKQRDTWLGLLAVVAALGIEFTPEQSDAIITACVGVGGLFAIVANK